ncbi:TIGR01777 family protein [Mucilaginibacter sp. PPCGB 2223]|uniref:TIGR01777 family oxidoreductase n=1 Tax=Mucilaginibacter sp. PPCGB 2223 TaxID=1886027 RepID=UPI000826EFF8|nr:TIGR01777 family oxidoreductase [Mucilaginibacter sp. PPCGB 2223]OCX51142.1 TIGR01777 family protein [Mucilaginibacter sp. PPCGB 2223]
MKYKKIILAGGNGYLGGVLAGYYRNLADEIIILSRKPKATDGNIKTLVWDGKTEGDWVSQLEGAEMLINLCGKNVNCRYTNTNREEIVNSRVAPTKLLGKVVEKLKEPPKLWINLSSATIYRHAEDRPQDEATGDIGYGFSIDVCQQWEAAFYESITPKTRKIALRMGIVLGMADSAFPRLFNLVKFGLGGKQGDGKQYLNWVHEQDAARCTEFLLQHTELDGAVNCTAPAPIQNAAFMATLRKAWGIPFGLPTAAWLLNIGMAVVGSERELILKSRWVIPTRLLDAGYQFLFAEAEYAIKDLLSITK